MIAAGVEESMKYFAVKCCKQLHPLSSPHAVLVCLMAAALGFATAENIEYVFSTPAGTEQSARDVFLSELVVLVVRLLMPIHVICSVLQAASLARVALGMQTFSTFRILLPAIALHGAFDFYLFVINAVAFIYDRNDDGIVVASIVGPVFITVIGIIWACVSFGRVVREYDSSWRVDPSVTATSAQVPVQQQPTASAAPVQATPVQNPMMAEAFFV